MRALLAISFVAGCQSSEPAPEPAPADRSLTLQGPQLEEFCRATERERGWTCDDYANCETAHERAGVVGGAVCRAKS